MYELRTIWLMTCVVAGCGGIKETVQPDAAPAPDSGVAAPDAPSCVPSPAALRARWRADMTTTDDLGVFDGTLSGGGYTPGRHGSAFVFDGIDDRVTADPADLLWPMGSFSLEAWVKTTMTPANFAMIVNKYGCGGASGCDGADYEFYINSTGRPVFSFRVHGSPIRSLTGSLHVVNDGQWHHLVGVRDIAAKQQLFYIDGEIAVTAPIDGIDLAPLLNIDGQPDPVTIGATQNNGADNYIGHLAGAVDEVAIYASAISAAEIAALHTARDGICR